MKVSEMSVSQFARFRRENGIKVSTGPASSTYVVHSKLQRALRGITREQFKAIVAKYGCSKNTTQEHYISRLITRLDRMEPQMVRYLFDEYDSHGVLHFVDVIKLSFVDIKSKIKAKGIYVEADIA